MYMCVCTCASLFANTPPQLTHHMCLHTHTSRVAKHSDRNLMKASNLGVVFGPTLMRPERESVATIVDIKYQNIIVEEMIEQMSKVRV